MQRIELTIDGQRVLADLDDSALAARFATALPLASQLRDELGGMRLGELAPGTVFAAECAAVEGELVVDVAGRELGLRAAGTSASAHARRIGLIRAGRRQLGRARAGAEILIERAD